MLTMSEGSLLFRRSLLPVLRALISFTIESFCELFIDSAEIRGWNICGDYLLGDLHHHAYAYETPQQAWNF